MGARGWGVWVVGGGFAEVSLHLVAGFGLADSWATDGHKWPNVNYDCGIVFVRDAVALRTAMLMSAAYLQGRGAA